MVQIGRPFRLLIVEDEYVIALLIEQIARNAGWRVVGPAPDLEKALALVENSDLDGAVLDIHLGANERSLSVAESLRDSGVPFIFATGLGPLEYRLGFEDTPVLFKPFGNQELVTAVRKHLMKEG